MDKRKDLILTTIIKEYIKSAIPVSSGVLVDKYKLDVSPATVRNEMAALEEDGFIMQPHTSAGRIPTESAYKYYVANLRPKKLKDLKDQGLSDLLKAKTEEAFKAASKHIAQISETAVFWAFHRRNLYYTGISNLLSQPEFLQNNVIYDISLIIDEMDVIIDKTFDQFSEDPSIKIGSDNPFSPLCSTIVSKYRLGNAIGMFGLIGPMRMDYCKGLAIISQVKELVEKS